MVGGNGVILLQVMREVTCYDRITWKSPKYFTNYFFYNYYNNIDNRT